MLKLISLLSITTLASVVSAEPDKAPKVSPPVAPVEEPLKVGDNAPAIESIDQEGKKVVLTDIFKEGATLIYFYPKSDTPGCTKQACNLRDAFEKVTEAKITVIGVSNDTVASQKAFQQKYKLPFTLLADTNQAVIKAFGVPTIRDKYASRQTFLVKGGKIIWRDLNAAPVTQAQKALEALNTHNASLEAAKKTEKK